VALIITTGPGMEGDRMNELSKEKDVYFLLKPYRVETLPESIEKAVTETRKVDV